MPMISRRHRTFLGLGLFLWILVGLTTPDLQSLELDPEEAASCPASLEAAEAPGAVLPGDGEQGADGAGPTAGPPEGPPPTLTVLQGNLWMLPSRPLLVPYAFSADREERLARLVATVRACRPAVVLLQEVFERSTVELLARHLPEYRVVDSGVTDVTGTINASGLVTLTRLSAVDWSFRPFGPLPSGSRTIEWLAQKGVLAVEVEGPTFRGTLLNLHLYAFQDPGEAGITESQLREVVAWAESETAAGRSVLVGGDFNLGKERLAALLPEGWRLSSHGPTYDPARNPYTVRGSNNTPENHRERQEGRGTRTIDFLLTPEGTPARVESRVLDTLLLSDHQFLHHTVVLADG